MWKWDFSSTAEVAVATLLAVAIVVAAFV